MVNFYDGNTFERIGVQAIKTGNAVVFLKYIPQMKSLLVINSENDMFKYEIEVDTDGQLSAKETDSFMLYNDEVLDLQLFKEQGNQVQAQWLKNKVVVSTNSSSWRLHDLVTQQTSYIEGHSDIVMVSDVFRNIVVTGSKDNSIKVWRVGKDMTRVVCLATLKGHMGNIISLSVSPKTGSHCVSISTDNTMKMWDISKIIRENDGASVPKDSMELETEGKSDKETLVGESIATVIGHSKEMNVVRFSPDEKLIATGSHDRMIKVWDQKFQTRFVFAGHKRGVWDVAFSPFARQLISASGDKTLKLWSLDKGSSSPCLNTLIGHTSSVLKASWLRFGAQVISGSADGMVKLWNIEKGTCVGSFEGHQGKIWTLCVKETGNELVIVSGGNDSEIILWKDETAEMLRRESEKKEMVTKSQMEIINMKRKQQFAGAVELAFDNEMGKTLYDAISDFCSYLQFSQDLLYTDLDDVDAESLNLGPEEQKEREKQCNEEIDSLVGKLYSKNKGKLLNVLRNMNSISKYYLPAQMLLARVCRRIGLNGIEEYKTSIPDFEKGLDIMMAYSERHKERLQKYLKMSHALDFFLEKTLAK